MLASVTHPEEALLALAGGADIIDCKDPGRGALGALSAATVETIIAAVAGRLPVSATIGDLPGRPELLAPAIRYMGATGVDLVKVGLFKTRGIDPLLSALAPLARRHALVAVLFADCRPQLKVIPALAQAGFEGVMLDTADKGSGGLMESAGMDLLEAFVAAARRADLRCGLAGGIRADAIAQLLPLGVDYLGFRGALCEAGRTTGLSAAAVERVRSRIPRWVAPPLTLPGSPAHIGP